MSDKIFAVAVDGPSGAGKSTLAKAVAAELGIVYVDTGAIYRSIGCYMHDHQIDPHDAQAVAAALPQVRIQIRYGADGLQRMILNDEDVTDRIRLPEMSKFASAVSAIPAVRAFLLDMQRDMAKQHSVIMDGRDIGTVVLPDADVKIYLTAGADVRAQRRMKELAERGTPRPYDEVLHETRTARSPRCAARRTRCSSTRAPWTLTRAAGPFWTSSEGAWKRETAE